MTDKTADLAGPGIGNYDDLEKILPEDYEALLSPKETMQGVFATKNYIEENLCKELNLQMVQVPLIVDRDSGVNDYLDRDGSRTPVEFPCGLGLDKPIHAQVVQAATKWKRMALKQFGCNVGEGICTDMKAVRKDYFLDHDHSAYVDQRDWEREIWSKRCSPDSRHPNIPTFPRNSPSCMPKKFSIFTRICRGNSGRRGYFWKSPRRFLLSVSAGP